ncbi:DNA polymerase III subunit alpha, partial [bacterium]|nr:DNA polymerase III subunit alpha [bacterium]
EQQRDNFIQGAQAKGVDADTGEAIFNLIARFGEYGFNKSHSLAYALLAYQTAWLKANYPQAYMAAMLSNEMQNTDKVALYISECRRMEIVVVPPDVNTGRERFRVDQDQIGFGLAAIRHVGVNAAQAIRQEREAKGNYSTLTDFCNRIDLRIVNARVIESLIKAGALDSIGRSRPGMLTNLPQCLASAQKWQEEKERGQMSIFGDVGPDIPVAPDAVAEEPERVRLTHEKEVLGFYLTGHPLVQHQDLLDTFSTATTGTLNKLAEGSQLVIGGEVVGVRHSATKRREPMLRFSLEDTEGLTEVIVWPDLLGSHKDYLVKDAMLFVVGKMDCSGDENRIIATDIVPLSEAFNRLARRLHLHLPLAMGEEQLAGLKELLGSHTGATPVYLHLPTRRHKEVVAKLPGRFNTAVDAGLVTKLKEMVGPDRVKIQGPVAG